MIKIISLIIIIVLTALTGNYFAANLKRRSELLKTAGYMLEEIEILLRFKSATVYEIIDALSSDRRFEKLTFLNNAAKLCHDGQRSFSEIWQESIDGINEPCFKKSDKLLLSSIGVNLGNSDLDGQLSAISLKKSELTSLINTSDEEYNRKAKLYRSMGMLTGAFIAILLI